jgi:hypothetical protein
MEISVSLTNPQKIAAKTEKLAGIYCLSHVYEMDLRGIISMAVSKGIAEERKSQKPREGGERVWQSWHAGSRSPRLSAGSTDLTGCLTG